jgi:hypothetical protein
MYWNYRVVQLFDQREYFIAEVYYDDNGDISWCVPDDTLKWEDYDDLKGTVESVQKAFDRPTRRVAEGDKLVEVADAS